MANVNNISKEKTNPKKVFGERVNRLAKLAKVPWEIAIMVGCIKNDDEAVLILKQIKSKKGTANDDLQWELLSGSDCMIPAIEKILGDNWSKLECNSKERISILADYLLQE